MSEYYLELRSIHLATVALSLFLFIVRGVGLLSGNTWPRVIYLRYATYFNDTLLLSAAILLVVVTGFNPLAHSWLAVKILLLVGYILLGIYAFRASRTFGQRLCFFVAAITVYLFMISVARAHHPLGFFSNLFCN